MVDTLDFHKTRTARRLLILERLCAAAIAAAVSNPEDNALASGVDAPTITQSATQTITANVYTIPAKPACFRVSNGVPTQRTDGGNSIYTVFPITKIGNGSIAGGNLTGWTGDDENYQTVWTVTQETDADVAEFALFRNSSAGRGYLFLVNGRYVSLTPTDLSSAGGGTGRFVKLTFPDRRPRTITVLGDSNQCQFQSVAVGATSSVWGPGSRADTMCVLSGDSFMEGQGLTYGARGMAMKIQHLAGFTRMFDLAIGTTGYWNNGSNNRRRQIDQMSDATRGWGRAGVPWTSPDAVFFANLYNDKTGASSGATISNQNGIPNGTLVSAAIQQYSRAAWEYSRSLYPDALHVVLGGFGGRTGPSADTLQGEALIKSTFDAWADDFSMYIPVNGDPTVTGFTPYQSGTGYIGATVGDGNSDLTTSTDATHPGDYGHDLLGRRIVADYRKRLFSMRTSMAA